MVDERRIVPEEYYTINVNRFGAFSWAFVRV
jgi:hypothetical protein